MSEKDVTPNKTKKVTPRKVKIVTRKAGGGVEFEQKAVPMWMSSGMVGAAIAGGAWWARSQGIGDAVNEETITQGTLQAIELGGIVMMAIGRYKAKTKLKLF